MDRHRRKASAFFTRSAHGLGRKLRLAISRSRPAPQTSLIFELPDELILSILSHVSPEPQLTGHYARFREQYCMEINDDHQERVRFLRPLSMTCRALRLRLLSWMWNFIEPSRVSWYDCRRNFGWNLIPIVDALHRDAFLAASVRFMTVHSPWNGEPMFVECLKSLPNLHTLEIGLVYERPRTILLKEALKGLKLPQIETLILPPAAHPLLEHCPNVEDVDWVIGDKRITSDEFLGSLASIQGSKIKRLAIPLVLEGNPSRFVAKCPRLTELAVFYPHPHPHPQDPREPTRGYPPCPVETTRSAISELVDACKTLPDFSTFEILHLALTTPPPRCWCGRADCGRRGPYTEKRKQALREEMKGVKDWAINCLNKPKTRYQEEERRKITALREQTKVVKGWAVGRPKEPKIGDHRGEGIPGGRKKILLRVIELSSVFTLQWPNDTAPPRFHLDSVGVEECEVWEIDNHG